METEQPRVRALLFQGAANRFQTQRFNCAGFDEPVVGTIYPRASVGWHGVPMGGLGTGYVCWDSDGRFSQYTIFNQLPMGSDVPVAHSIPFQLTAGGRTFALAMRGEGGEGDLRDLRYFGHFPIVDTQLEVELPLGIEVRAYAPFIPGDALTSHTPAIVFEVHLQNRGDTPLDLTLAFTPPPLPTPIASATRFEEGGWSGIAIAHNWPAAGPNLGTRPVQHQLAVAVESGDVEASATIPTARFSATLAAGEQLARRFILAWYQPYVRDSKLRAERLRYADRFADATAVARTAIADHQSWLNRIIGGQQAIYRRENLSPALREALVNAPYALCKNTHWIARWRPDDWFPENGLLVTNESFTTCPITETLPCHYLGGFPLLFFFPELELTTLEAYRHYQLSTGEVPFAFDRGFGVRSPYYQMQHSNGIGEYIELIHRYWLRTGDDGFLRDFYPSARLAFRYLSFLDYDNDGLVNEHPHALPEEEWPANVPWDRWCQRDTAPYTAIKGLAATLSLERMAKYVGDEATEAQCRERFARGSERLEQLLWNGQYYRLWADQTAGKVDESCLMAQVTGAWDEQLLGLEPVIPRKRLESALRSIVQLTNGHSPFGLVLAGNPDGTPVYANDLPVYPSDSMRCDFARDVWPSYNFILAAICAHQALSAEEGMQAAHRVIDDLFHGANNMPWGWPCNIHAYTGWVGHGHDYNDPQAIWTIPLALDGQNLATGVGPDSLVGAILAACQV